MDEEKEGGSVGRINRFEILLQHGKETAVVYIYTQICGSDAQRT